MVTQGLSASILGRAAEKGMLSIEAVNIRDYTLDKHKKVDDYPYGGGAGMLMQAQPVYDAWKSVADRIEEKREPAEQKRVSDRIGAKEGLEEQDHRGDVTEQGASHRPVRTVYLTPQGTTFTQAMAKELAQEEELVLLCGHYEGIDERVLEEIVTDYVSIGDYVLTGGELPAMVLVDAIARMVPGVLNNEVSGVTESFEGNLLEYPQYSRPEEWRGKRVPEVLLSGNQKKIDAWRLEEAVKRTRQRRPDLYERYEALQNCLETLKKQKLLHMDMTELIVRGQARLVYAKGGNVCLEDMASGIYFHTAENPETGRRMLEAIREDAGAHCRAEATGYPSAETAEYALEETAKSGGKAAVELLVLHQDFMIEPARELLNLDIITGCLQAVYTKKEKLPITGLYRLDGQQQEGQPRMRKLDIRYLDTVAEHYDGMDATEETRDYLKERIEKGWMFGAFFGEELAGFVGMHTEGSIGMLTVLPEYRGRKLGKALETYAINVSLEQGFTPYGQVKEGNEISLRLQESLGLCFSKTQVYWLERC